MAYTRAHYDLGASRTRRGLAAELGLKNLGLSVYVLGKGEGYDYFHNHRDQEEVYFCIDGAADLVLAGDDAKKIDKPERLTLKRGDAVRVEARTLRAIGNLSSPRAVVVIAGACPHPYPGGITHHDVIADVLSVCGQGKTGFKLPPEIERQPPPTGSDADY